LQLVKGREDVYFGAMLQAPSGYYVDMLRATGSLNKRMSRSSRR
jgi:hypothetical protein